MKTVIAKHKIENNFYSIAGFGDPVIDPVATKRKIEEDLKKTDSYRALQELDRLLELNFNAYLAEREKGIDAKKKKDQKNMIKAINEGKKIQVQRKVLAGQVAAHKRIQKDKYREIMLKDPIYCHPRAGEIIITDEQAVEYSEKMRENRENGGNIINKIFCIELSEKRDIITGSKFISLP